MDTLTKCFERDVFQPYVALLQSEYRIHDRFSYARKVWAEQLNAQELVNGPFLEQSRIYARGATLDTLTLHQQTKETIQHRLRGHNLYYHQTEALRQILAGKNAVIATGTSSGKTLCYQIPILDDLLKDPRPGLRAIIIYPLNALVNDQLEEWETMLKPHPHLTFARFTGQTPNTDIDYRNQWETAFERELQDQGLKQHELQRKVRQRMREQAAKDEAVPNRLNHREAIRANPPHVLITNFSMLEYLLERPVDASVFEGAHLKFIVLDEVHAYRGVQATEIAFLIRRLKDRLRLAKLSCIATSATLGNPADPSSRRKVQDFAAELFQEPFAEPNPIYGKAADPELQQPSFAPQPAQYLAAAECLRRDPSAQVTEILAPGRHCEGDLAALLLHDENLYLLRADILREPVLLREAAHRLWPDDPQAAAGLEALLEIVGEAKREGTAEDLLPTRLHYFVRAQAGLHVCLHRQCPQRRSAGEPAFFVARKSEDRHTPEGWCPACYRANRRSKLVETVTCRKCGYLFGALQDLGPRRAQNEENAPLAFDVFETELGWAADAYWSYFSVADEVPFPEQLRVDEDDDDEHSRRLFEPDEVHWCVICGKKRSAEAGDNCTCDSPHLRTLRIFHRQCPADQIANLTGEKKMLTACPNCGARNASGLEPVRRFQESDDEVGLAMALPLAHFQVRPVNGDAKPPRKLLCFTDHRQRAAAFPALLEEETFTRDLGRKIVRLVQEPLLIEELGDMLAVHADPREDDYDPDFFLPVSRLPDPETSAKEMPLLWQAEAFSYFGIPDAARESVEDLGLIAVEYELTAREKRDFHTLLPGLEFNDAVAALQTLLAFIRQRKAFTLPPKVRQDLPAFGRVIADISFALHTEGRKSVRGWLPKVRQDDGYNDNYVTDYLKRLLNLTPAAGYALGEKVWSFLCDSGLLLEKKGTAKLDCERMLVRPAPARYVCGRCRIVTAYAARQCCPRKGCRGVLETQPFVAEDIVARWVAGCGDPQFTTLRSEEHTAQVKKDVARRVEELFKADGNIAGVNLLSSTTTFEMGINIGDLQKVLLRNAPPSSASYVQRVGRAGRGRDKNAVCVTLCRRAKYDADMWREPGRLMSGQVRTPTVFTKNRVIAQRHFNAVLFARFLRVKVRDEKLLGEVKQTIRLAPFLAPEARAHIPAEWLQVQPPTLHLDFPAWLATQSQADFFHTPAGVSLLEAVTGFADGQAELLAKYADVHGEIAAELAALLAERKKLIDLGKDEMAAKIKRSVTNILSSSIIDQLAKRGFLPRYAFPLDTVSLETEWSRWGGTSDVELSRDRALAIAEFAPGAQVIARKKVFTSAGLYILSRADKPEKRWYARCPRCQQIRTSPPEAQSTLFGPCDICQQTINRFHTKIFVEPKAFSVRLEGNNANSARHRRSSLIRQRQSLTHFIDNVDDSEFEDFDLFRLALKAPGKLFRYNAGPKNEGFMLCPDCGCSQPNTHFKVARGHQRLRPQQGNFKCENTYLWQKVSYGHEFASFCLVAQLARPGSGRGLISSLAFALQRGLCQVLEVETSDIGVTGRWRTGRGALTGAPEIVLFDDTPGGAGFVGEGYQQWGQVVAAARDIVAHCVCDVAGACYDCLKSYGNQGEHENLSRRTVLDYLEN